VSERFVRFNLTDAPSQLTPAVKRHEGAGQAAQLPRQGRLNPDGPAELGRNPVARDAQESLSIGFVHLRDF
jgi:hypothetical protein